MYQKKRFFMILVSARAFPMVLCRMPDVCLYACLHPCLHTSHTVRGIGWINVVVNPRSSLLLLRESSKLAGRRLGPSAGRFGLGACRRRKAEGLRRIPRVPSGQVKKKKRPDGGARLQGRPFGIVRGAPGRFGVRRLRAPRYIERKPARLGVDPESNVICKCERVTEVIRSNTHTPTHTPGHCAARARSDRRRWSRPAGAACRSTPPRYGLV